MPPVIALYILSVAINKLHSLENNTKEQIIQHEQALKAIQDALELLNKPAPTQ